MEFNATLLISTISFIVFTIIMNKVLYAPMSKIVAKRHLYLEQNAVAVALNKDEARAVIEDKDSKIMNAKKQSKDEIIHEMEKTKKAKVQTIQNKKAELTQKTEQHKKELENEKTSLSAELENCAQGISDTILGKISGGKNV